MAAHSQILNNRYELIAQQGSGGMSVIYKAIDLALQRTVAVKVLRPSLTADESFLIKFREEAQRAANLSHPNIVTVHDVGHDKGIQAYYIIMELVEGQDLKRIIRSVGNLSVERVVNLGIQICAGIGYAHRSGIVHADVKPQNILVTPQDAVKVTDFGIAQALTDTQPSQRADIVWGSPHYFAPEQARGEQPSPASDVYSIGIVLFEMLTGRLPYTGNNQQELALAHIQNPIPMVTEFNPSVPESLANIVFKVMSKDAQGRYRTADQLGHVLQNYRSRSRDNTIANTQQPVDAGRPAPSQPHIGNRPSTNPGKRPPGIGVVAPADPTARYSPAPNAPQPYNPNKPQGLASGPSVPGPQSPQPLQQNYVTQVPPPPVPPNPTPTPPAPKDANPYYGSGYSQPRPPVKPESGTRDYVTIALAIMAIMAVAGLVPLFLAVIAARAG